MNIPFDATWEKVRSSLWFVPSVMVAAAAVLSVLTVAIDRKVVDAPGETLLLYGGGAEGARALLGAVASSMMTVAGVVFSVTIVALTLASQQFGPRVLRNFMEDAGNRVVLGTFIATFVYCLLVVRTIRGGDTEFVPHVSVTVGVLLALASLGVLIYFIHHVATSIQAETVIARIAEEFQASVDRLYPEHLGTGDRRPETAEVPATYATRTELRASADGYIQRIDEQKVMATAAEYDVLLQFHHEPGDFVQEGDVLTEVHSREVPPEQAREAITSAFMLGSSRTPSQDLQFTIDQLVQLTVRALSPSLNDPFTAMSAIDRIIAGLRRLGTREFPSQLRADENAVLRVIAYRKSFDDMVMSTLRALLESASSSEVVLKHLKGRLESMAAGLHPSRRAVVRAAIDEVNARIRP